METKKIVTETLELADIAIDIAYEILFNQIEKEKAKDTLFRLDNIKRRLTSESRLIC